MKRHSYKLSFKKIELHSQGVRYASRGNRAMSFTTKQYNDFKKEIKLQLENQLESEIMKNACYVSLNVFYPIPTSFSKSKRQSMIYTPKITTPDVDNLAKSILDGMSGVIFEDDKLITNLQVNKLHGELEQEEIIIRVIIGEM